MKKLFYPLAALLLTAAPASAQVVMENYGNGLLGIPCQLTSAKVPYIIDTEEGLKKNGHGKGTIYDHDLNKILTFEIPATDNLGYMDYTDLYDEDGFSLDVNGDLIVSQTLFNDDEDWEYINRKEETYRLLAYEVKKLDGTVIGTLDATKYWIDGIVKLGKKFYIVVEEDFAPNSEGTYKFYTIGEFRKLFNPATRVAATPAMVKSGQTFDLSGRRTRSNAHGIVVKNNKKVLK